MWMGGEAEMWDQETVEYRLTVEEEIIPAAASSVRAGSIEARLQWCPIKSVQQAVGGGLMNSKSQFIEI